MGRSGGRDGGGRGEWGKKKACEVAAAPVCTLSQNGYGDHDVAPLYVRSSPKSRTVGAVQAPASEVFADGHTELNAPDLF